jgi:hypothetical protein
VAFERNKKLVSLTSYFKHAGRCVKPGDNSGDAEGGLRAGQEQGRVPRRHGERQGGFRDSVADPNLDPDLLEFLGLLDPYPDPAIAKQK